MRRSAVYLSESYDVPDSYRADLAQASTVFGHGAPTPDELGGHFDFVDWRGSKVSKENFLGRWTYIYFGYARCQGTCRTAAPLLAEAARALRDRGFSAKAAFVDIEPAPLGMIEPSSDGSTAMTHGSNWEKRMAMGRLALRHRADLEVLTGSRYQLAQATAAYHVLREHMLPRPGVEDINISHSSSIYLVGPDTLIAGYGYHDMGVETMVDVVDRLSNADRNPFDPTAIRQRYIDGICGE